MDWSLGCIVSVWLLFTVSHFQKNTCIRWLNCDPIRKAQVKLMAKLEYFILMEKSICNLCFNFKRIEGNRKKLLQAIISLHQLIILNVSLDYFLINCISPTMAACRYQWICHCIFFVLILSSSMTCRPGYQVHQWHLYNPNSCWHRQ